MKNKNYSRQSGFGLVQVVISASIFAVLLLIMAQYLTTMMNENSAMIDKLASTEVFRSTSNYLSNYADCSALFQPSNLVAPISLPTPSSVTSASPYVVKFNALPYANGASSLLTAGTQASIISSRLNLLSATGNPGGIQLEVTSITPPTANGTLKINFDQSQILREVKNLEYPIMMSVLGNQITGCYDQSSLPHCQTIRIKAPSYTSYYALGDRLNAFGTSIPTGGQNIGQPGDILFTGTIYYPAKSYPPLATSNVITDSLDHAWLSTLGRKHGLSGGFAPVNVTAMPLVLVSDSCPTIY